MSHPRHLSFRWLLGLAAISISSHLLVPLASARTQPHSAAAAKTKTIRVAASEFNYKLSSRSIHRPGEVAFTVRNTGHMPHNFRIDGKQSPIIQPGKTGRLVVRFKKKGKYRYVCTLPGHAAAGMKGVFTVR